MSETTEEVTTSADSADADGKTFTQGDVDRIIEQRLSRERSKYADYEQLKAAADELNQLRESEKTELQRAIERAEEAERRAVEADLKSIKASVAATKGVPIGALVGKTEDELNASADALLEWRGTKPDLPKPGSPSLKSGATGSEATDYDPKVAAVEALRRLRGV